MQPQTFLIAIRMCQSVKEVPSQVTIPSRDLGHRILPCHAIDRAWRLGQTIAVGKEDARCPYGEIALGFYPVTKAFRDGWITGYLNTKEAAAKIAEIMPRLEY